MLRTWQLAIAVVLEPSGLRAEISRDTHGIIDRPTAGILTEQPINKPTTSISESTYPTHQPVKTHPTSSTQGQPRRHDLMVNTLRGSTGLFYTILPVRTGRYAFRLRFHGDYFRKRGMFCCLGDGNKDDSHFRLRGSVNVGLSITPWLETFAAFHSQANRNQRVTENREDPPTTFALGDIDLGFKLAHQFRNSGIGIGSQVDLGLLSDTKSTSNSQIKFSVDGLFSIDLRHLTRKATPIRFSTNIGWILDNSHKLVDWSRFSDPVSREVLRFSTGADQNRIRTRWAMDFPMRLGRKKSIGIDPVLEYSWNISTQENELFRGTTAINGPSVSPRSQGWLSLGIRANLYAGLHLDCAIDVGTSSPNYEFGTPIPAWQVNFGLAWAFDPSISRSYRPTPIQTIASKSSPPATTLPFKGSILDRDGRVIANAKVSVLAPRQSLQTNTILSAEDGSFQLFALKPGPITLQVDLDDGRTLDQRFRIECDAPSCKTAKPIRIQFRDPPPLTPIEGHFTDEQGRPIIVAIDLIGKQLNRELSTDNKGRFTTKVPTGVYTVRSHHPQFVDSFITIHVDSRPLNFGSTLIKRFPGSDSALQIQTDTKQIYLPKEISYQGNSIDPQRVQALDSLATFLIEHPEYLRIEIQVHTHDRGNPLQRSQSRAESVLKYLVNRGLPRERLSAVGQGDKHPVAVNITSQDRRKNDRTVLIVRRYRAPVP